MGCDMVVALKQATVQGNTLFGLNHHDHRPANAALCRIAGALHAPDEVLRLGGLLLPQVRRTSTVLGSQPCGAWGLTHGLNEHRVAVGFSSWQSKLSAQDTGLLGTDLTRLTLERSQSARQAFDILTDLVTRHGQRGSGQPNLTDSIFLLADPKEAYVVEVAGCHWAMLECQQVRAVSDVALIRQDWRRLAPGLAELAISRGWWSDDGSKLDVTGSLAAVSAANHGPLKRWGKATLALEQQNGSIDSFFLRNLLTDQLDAVAEVLPPAEAHDLDMGQPLRLVTTFIVELPLQAHALPVIWCTYGPHDLPLFFPVLVDGELPHKVSQHAVMAPMIMKLQSLLELPEHVETVREMLEKVQAQFDQQLEEFLKKGRGDGETAPRQAGQFMQKNWEILEGEYRLLPALDEGPLAVR